MADSKRVRTALVFPNEKAPSKNFDLPALRQLSFGVLISGSLYDSLECRVYIAQGLKTCG